MYERLIRDAADRHLPGWDWRLLYAQCWKESRFDARAVSPAGARGLMQFMPRTWGQWGQGKDIEDPGASIDAGARYMAHLIERWSSPRPDMDRYCLALASYNAGMANVLNAQRAAGGALMYADIAGKLHMVTGDKSKETTTYVRKILVKYATQITGA